MRSVLVTGGTGFIGRALCRHLLDRDCRLTVLTRDTRQSGLMENSAVRYVSGLDEIPAESAIDSIVNLAGQSLNSGRWTPSLKEKFVSSRVDTTDAVVAWAGRRPEPPSVLVSASAIGWYGHRGDTALNESSDARGGYSHRLCERWEQSACAGEAIGMRVVRLRIGIVLERDGGPLPELLPAFRIGAGGPLGTGEQYWSWIHRGDLVRLFEFAMDEWALNGAVNATAPGPVRQKEFARTLADILHRPAVIPLPGSIARLMLGEFADELLLNGQRVLPEKALQHGFEFAYPRLPDALAAILRR